MGCRSSTFQANNTFDGFYKNAACSTLKRSSSKRNFSSRISSASSGSSSACDTPKRRNILSRCLPKSSSKHVAESVYSNDFATEKQLQSAQRDSSGYFTASMATDSAPSTPANNSYLVRTMDSSDMEKTPFSSCWESSSNSSSSSCSFANSSSSSENAFNCYGELQQEMYMKTHSPAQMPKTSSPIVERRDVLKTRPTATYQRWRNHLQTMPDCVPLNVTDIPEAIAGQFTPFGFPGYTDLQEAMCSAAKRYKCDEPQAAPPAMGGVITTEL